MQRPGPGGARRPRTCALRSATKRRPITPITHTTPIALTLLTALAAATSGCSPDKRDNGQREYSARA